MAKVRDRDISEYSKRRELPLQAGNGPLSVMGDPWDHFE
jgi:hypothetical protein